MRKALLSIWFLALFFSIFAQDVIVSYETVHGLSQTDTVLVYMQSTDSQPKNVGAVSFSLCFQNPATPQLSAIQSVFSAKWGGTYEKVMVLPIASSREGISYQNKLFYGVAAYVGQPVIAPEAATGPMLVMKIPFSGGATGYYYLERPAQNAGVSVGSYQAMPYDILVIDKAQPFPVEWLYIEAEPLADRKTKISWATASETHNDYFSIEKSPNGKDFTQLATVQGAFFANAPLNYEYLDATQMFANTFYRLVQVDLSGRRTNSDIIEVKFSDAADSWLSVYPNPVKDFIILDPLVEVKGHHHFRLVNIQGALMLGHDWKPIFKKMRLSLENLSPGMYFLQTKDETGKVDLLRLVKK